MSSLDQDQNELYKQIIQYLTPAAAEPKVGAINRVKIQIAEQIVMKFPSLAAEDNKYALLMAVDIKFNDLKDVIIQHETERECQARQTSEADSRTRRMLVNMGVVPPLLRRPVVPTLLRTSSDMDDDFPF